MSAAAVAFASPEEELAYLELLELQQAERIQLAKEHPAYFLDGVEFTTEKTGEKVKFDLLDPEAPWYWQRTELFDEWIQHQAHIHLKARQIGVTWCAGGFGLWKAVMTPGVRILILSKGEKDAHKVVKRVWSMWLWLKKNRPWLVDGIEVLTPKVAAQPSGLIELRHPNGDISTIEGLAANAANAHGNTAAVVILDEFAYAEEDAGIFEAAVPTAGDEGIVLVISTANGTYNEKTQAGSEFHRIWIQWKENGFRRHFHGWSKAPDRDDEWYQRVAMKLPADKRARQYPSSPTEAFRYAGSYFFNQDDLVWYDENAVLRPKFSARFVQKADGSGRWQKGEFEPIEIYRRPEKDRKYALIADVASGDGKDYSAALVIDLSTAEWCALIHGKLGYGEYAKQLHYLGRYYNTALIVPEDVGGYGAAIIEHLRDGHNGRPPYPQSKIYQHEPARPKKGKQNKFGYPTSGKTRPLITDGLREAVAEREFEALPRPLLEEMVTFVNADNHPTPRAQDGSNDDIVLAACIAWEIFRQKGVRGSFVGDARSAARARRERGKPLTGLARYGIVEKKPKNQRPGFLDWHQGTSDPHQQNPWSTQS